MLGRQTGAGQDPLDRRHDAAVVDLSRRQVHLHRSLWAVPHVMVPGPQLVAGLLEDPRPDGDDQPALLGHRHEPGRGHQPLVGMLPADQGLDTYHRGHTADLDHRLVVEHELVPLEGPMEEVLGGHAVERLDPHRLTEYLDPRASPSLGPVHGRFGVGQEGAAVVDPEGVEGDAHRCVQEELRTIDGEGPRTAPLWLCR